MTLRAQFWRHVADADDLAVADVPDGAVDVAHPGDPEADGLDGADGLAEVDLVADAVLVLEDHEDAGQEVADQALGAEAERDADDAGAGDDRADVDADLARASWCRSTATTTPVIDALEQRAHRLGALHPAGGRRQLRGSSAPWPRAERPERQPADPGRERAGLGALRPAGRRAGAGSSGARRTAGAARRRASGVPIRKSDDPGGAARCPSRPARSCRHVVVGAQGSVVSSCNMAHQYVAANVHAARPECAVDVRPAVRPSRRSAVRRRSDILAPVTSTLIRLAPPSVLSCWPLRCRCWSPRPPAPRCRRGGATPTTSSLLQLLAGDRRHPGRCSFALIDRAGRAAAGAGPRREAAAQHRDRRTSGSAVRGRRPAELEDRPREPGPTGGASGSW